jgi:putative ABC transport system ATP-binding protein
MTVSAAAIFCEGVSLEQPPPSWTSSSSIPYRNILPAKERPFLMHMPTNPADIAIRARNVTLSLGTDATPVEILKGIDLDIVRGESLAILGASGSGKSSLMAVLSGLERASGGEVRVAGVDYGALDEDGLARARRGRIGIVLQSFHLLPTMTAIENVAVPLELAGHGDAFARAREELGAVGLGHRLDHYPAQLSGGEQQRVAIARAVAISPDIIFADEPTGNLDAATGAAVIDLLFARQAAAEATLVIITHDSSLAERCDRIVEMRDGRIMSERAI